MLHQRYKKKQIAAAAATRNRKNGESPMDSTVTSAEHASQPTQTGRKHCEEHSNAQNSWVRTLPGSLVYMQRYGVLRGLQRIPHLLEDASQTHHSEDRARTHTNRVQWMRDVKAFVLNKSTVSRLRCAVGHHHNGSPKICHPLRPAATPVSNTTTRVSSRVLSFTHRDVHSATCNPFPLGTDHSMSTETDPEMAEVEKAFFAQVQAAKQSAEARQCEAVSSGTTMPGEDDPAIAELEKVFFAQVIEPSPALALLLPLVQAAKLSANEQQQSEASGAILDTTLGGMDVDSLLSSVLTRESTDKDEVGVYTQSGALPHTSTGWVVSVAARDAKPVKDVRLVPSLLISCLLLFFNFSLTLLDNRAAGAARSKLAGPE
eukprot:2372642-Rhodomonas_salina.1